MISITTMHRLIPIIIPSYEPDERLLDLLHGLEREHIGPIVIVNDGSGAQYNEIFEKAELLIQSQGGVLLNHTENRGKGRALKTSFSYVLENMGENVIGVITTDSDGQHTVECIKKIKAELQKNPNNLILGSRNFDGEDIPWKSRFGNKITEKIFSYVAGVHVTDTQTGLRGIPRDFMKQLLNVNGERFEFETQMLLESVGKYPIIEVEIKTIYDSKENHQTHFNPFWDSIKIYKILAKQFLKYIFASLSSCIVDVLLFTLFCFLLKEELSDTYIALSTILARVMSATYNYLINYKIVFHSNERHGKSSIKYILLAVCQMSISALLVTVVVKSASFLPEVVVKMLVDTILFFISYYIQQRYVFNGEVK